MKNSKLFGIILAVVTVLLMTACIIEPTGGPTNGGSGDPYNFKKPDDKVIDVDTKGQLTITGLGSYEGTKLFAGREVNNKPSILDRFDIAAYDSTQNYYRDGKVIPFPPEYGIVNNGQVILKVFLWFSSGYQSYNGNDSNVKFTVYMEVIYPNTQKDLVDKGTVTVNFVNGVGTGVFVPK